MARKKREVIYFDSPDIAQEVLYDLEDILRQKKFVTLKDFYDLVKYSTEKPDIDKYGWIDLEKAEVHFKILKFYTKDRVYTKEVFWYIAFPRIRKLVREVKQ